jgi:putative glutamine amidotransferase
VNACGPTIGVAASPAAHARAYVDAVERSGGIPISPALTSDMSISEALERADGIVVGGPDGDCEHPDAVRLITAARDAGLPLLCIGSGMQALNAASGGSTVDLPGHAPADQGGEQVSSYHRIYIAPGSKLAATVGSGGFVRVNSRHRTGVREAQKSPALMASAYSLEDGVIEALESPDHRWIIGVQFHPERRLELPPHFGKLFDSLVEWSRQPRDRKK